MSEYRAIPPGQSHLESDDEAPVAGGVPSPALLGASLSETGRGRKRKMRPTAEHEMCFNMLIEMGYPKKAVELVIFSEGITDIGDAVGFLQDNPTGERCRPKRNRSSVARLSMDTEVHASGKKGKKRKTNGQSLQKAAKKKKATPKKKVSSQQSKTPATDKKAAGAAPAGLEEAALESKKKTLKKASIKTTNKTTSKATNKAAKSKLQEKGKKNGAPSKKSTLRAEAVSGSSKKAAAPSAGSSPTAADFSIKTTNKTTNKTTDKATNKAAKSKLQEKGKKNGAPLKKSTLRTEAVSGSSKKAAAPSAGSSPTAADSAPSGKSDSYSFDTFEESFTSAVLGYKRTHRKEDVEKMYRVVTAVVLSLY